MKYTVEVDGAEFEVDGIEWGTFNGSEEGNIDLFITIFDSDRDIYTDSSKKDIWVDWLDKCLGDKHNPGERIKPVTVKIWGGDDDEEPYRTIKIQHACIASFTESSGNTNYSYTVTIMKAARKAKKDLVQVQSN